MLSKIFLEKEKYKDYDLLNGENCLDKLGRINVFIGQNNSGKSRFLRRIFTDEKFEFQLKRNDLTKVIALIEKKRYNLRHVLDSHGYEVAYGITEIADTFLKESGNFKIGEVKSQIEKARNVAEYYSNMSSIGHAKPKTTTAQYTHPDIMLPAIKEIGFEIAKLIEELFSSEFDFKFEKIYIPILKGLRPIQTTNTINDFEQKDNYKIRTVKDYFINDYSTGIEKIEREIFTGLSLYEDTKKLLLGDRAGRDRIKKFEEFLSQTFFEGAEITLIPHIENDVLKIGIDKEERFVYQLGDGIQSIIILLYPLFFNQDKNLLVFIEEPENSLHPGMQRIFLETLMRQEFKNFQFFFTTHSNHFLDITLDLESISIYTFHKLKNEKADKFICRIENTSNEDVKILDLIGARNSSVFLSNCTIWVEGITDRLYLKKYLELYQSYLLMEGSIKTAYKEDFHFSFVEYGGGNIVHWSFTNELGWEKMNASKLSSKIFVIADKDNTDEKVDSAKAKRLAVLREKLGDRFRIISGTEIENTLSEQVLIKTISALQKRKIVDLKFDESEIKIADYQNARLGEYIEQNFSGLSRQYKADSGTISCKLDFCKAAIGVMKVVDDLSEEGGDIARSIFEFIRDSNSF